MNRRSAASIYADKIPLHPSTVSAAEEFHMEPVIAALNGGEDYELLFTVPLKDFETIARQPGISIIGHITEPGEKASAGCSWRQYNRNHSAGLECHAQVKTIPAGCGTRQVDTGYIDLKPCLLTATMEGLTLAQTIYPMIPRTYTPMAPRRRCLHPISGSP